jgi:Helix-turn-helix domain
MTLEELRALLARLPVDGALPVGWVREQLDALGPEPIPAGTVDLTAGDLARRWQRGASTVRTLCETKQLEGAYKFGREWRIPRATVERYEQAQREGQGEPAVTGPRDRFGIKALVKGPKSA